VLEEGAAEDRASDEDEDAVAGIQAVALTSTPIHPNKIQQQQHPLVYTSIPMQVEDVAVAAGAEEDRTHGVCPVSSHFTQCSFASLIYVLYILLCLSSQLEWVRWIWSIHAAWLSSAKQ
jgi:hypothetical protein